MKPFQQNSCPQLCSTNTRHKHDLQIPNTNLTLLSDRSVLCGKKSYSTPPLNINTLNYDIKTYFSQHWSISWLIKLCTIPFHNFGLHDTILFKRSQNREIGSSSLKMEKPGMIWCRRPKPM